ncbi:MAG: RagB/SusD family nutrient uptake outer membrane protein [Flavobacteriaceae bacterium]|jgi:hypothetical protein
MKKYIIIFTGLITFSCSDFLEEEVFTQYEPTAFLSSESGINATLTAAYRKSRPNYREEWFTFGEWTSDLMLERGGGYAAPAATFAEFNWNPSNNFFRNIWRDKYGAIGVTNSILDNIDNVTSLPASKIASLKAEATFLRAYNYVLLYDFFGPIPLITTGELNLTPSRASDADVKSFIESELIAAAQDLPVEPDVYGKATKTAALALLGRFYLDTKQWQKAADTNKQVMDVGKHSLFPNVEGVFSVENEQNAEMIFVFGSLATAPIQALAWNYTPHAYPVGYQTGQVNYGAQFQLWRWFVNSFHADDRRANEYDPPNGKFGWILKSYINKNGEFVDLMNDPITAGVEKKYPRPVKFTPDPNGLGPRHGNDMPILRYAEVLVNRAEALNELNGPSQEVIDLLNQVRSRSNAPDYNLADYPTKEALRDQILVERGWEFHAEGHRRRSLIRHGSFISGAQARGKVNAKSHHVLFPVPQAELDSNAALEQNPGY